jgi:HAD superfamily hydrolase (TIGR01509 family)
MSIKGVLLDIDGTVVLSNDAHAEAWAEAFAEHGYDIPVERIRPLIGMGGDKLMPELVPGLSDEEGVGKQISDRRKEIFLEKYAPKLAAANGGRELVERIKDEGLKLVVASSAKSNELEALLKAAHIEDLVEEATTSSDVEESKPAPDIVEVALQKIGLEPNEVVLIGDTPYDIEAASKCGVDVLVVACGGFSEEQLRGAREFYQDPKDLLTKFDKSPLARSA